MKGMHMMSDGYMMPDSEMEGMMAEMMPKKKNPLIRAANRYMMTAEQKKKIKKGGTGASK